MSFKWSNKPINAEMFDNYLDFYTKGKRVTKWHDFLKDMLNVCLNVFN